MSLLTACLLSNAVIIPREAILGTLLSPIQHSSLLLNHPVKYI